MLATGPTGAPIDTVPTGPDLAAGVTGKSAQPRAAVRAETVSPVDVASGSLATLKPVHRRAHR